MARELSWILVGKVISKTSQTLPGGRIPCDAPETNKGRGGPKETMASLSSRLPCSVEMHAAAELGGQGRAAALLSLRAGLLGLEQPTLPGSFCGSHSYLTQGLRE